MAWTTPRTWVTDELVTASLMNTHVRDNLNAVPHLVVRKSADESVTSSITPQNDDHLSMSVGASEVWLTRWVLRYTCVDAATGLRLVWTFPAGGSIDSSFVWASTVGTASPFAVSGTTSPSSDIAMGAAVTGSQVNVLSFDLVYIGAGTAGTLQLQWAQTATSGTATVVKAQSTLWGAKIA